MMSLLATIAPPVDGRQRISFNKIQKKDKKIKNRKGNRKKKAHNISLLSLKRKGKNVKI